MPLNSQQQLAVTTIGHPVLVLAGAGSGKTGVITQKIVYLIRDCQYKAYQVVALTFTNKAAREMQERVGKVLKDKERKGLWISTFHTLGLRILKEDGHYLGFTKQFSVFDSRDSLEVIKEITKKSDDKELKQLLSEVSHIKNEALNQITENDDISLVARAYNDYLLAVNAVDFDDLIIHCIRLFEQFPEVLQKWQRRIRYLLLDEYQDTNIAQYQLVKCLTGVSGHFTAVGDDDQSIYSWRGANVENLNLLSQDFPTLEVIKLEQNYRCDKKILHVANELIAHNEHLFDKKLWSEIVSGDKVQVNAYRTDEEESQSVISDLIMHHQKTGAKLNDYVLLYRGNYQSRVLEKQLRTNRIPYVINGATSFFEHVEIRDLLAYLRLIANPEDHQSFVRIVNTPKREIGSVTMTRLSQYARGRGVSLIQACSEMGLTTVLSASACQKLHDFANWVMSLHERSERDESPSEILNWVLKDTEYEPYVSSLYPAAKAEKRIQLIYEFKDWIKKLEEKDDIYSLSDVVQRVLLLDMLENKSEKENKIEAVSLMTLHAAKGLEFPYVYIIGLEEGLLPHANASDTAENISEERRLLYVGITRAKYRLYLSFAQNRKVGKNMTATKISRFLYEIPEDSVQWNGVFSEKMTGQEKQQYQEDTIGDLLDLLGDE